MLSIITPHYEGTNPFIEECYQSLCKQTLTGWEWIIVVNNGGKVPPAIRGDERVWCVRHESEKIGALKRFGFEQAQGDILVELDADDMLTSDCLAELTIAFEDEDISFAYSNSAQFTDKTWAAHKYNEYWGWEKRPFIYEGHQLWEMIAFDASPHSMRAIYWSPNHVRAWRAADYRAIGGHNVEMAVIDDYELLCRTYLYDKKMIRIDKCLYLYREHDGQITKTSNPAIQAENWHIYERYIIPMAERWSRMQGLPMLDLCGGHNSPDGYVSIDLYNADIIHNLNDGIPYETNSVGIVRAHDALEHLENPVHTMNEIHRVLVPGGWLLVSVPSSDGRGAFQDPTHKSFWNENSFWYYTDPKFAAFISESTAQFQIARVLTWFPSDWHKKHNISYVDAQLIAVKPGYILPGECPGENKWRIKK